ncbi:MAG: glycosyltransferase, partial [Acidobacteria bacterium]|nr:glycosyltransferase [Acidobacteriota bacterium]
MSKHSLISVIIPTFNNCPILRKVLQSLLLQQKVGKDFEVIVLDDGSEDDTGRMVEEIAAGSNVPIRYEWQRNRGVSAARNRALTLAEGKYSLLLGDDIIPAPDLIWRHLSTHERYHHGRNVVIGRVTWPDE